MRLHDLSVTVRTGGVAVRTEPEAGARALGRLPAGETVRARALLWDETQSWLQIPWTGENGDPPSAWIDGAATDFARSPAYSQVANAWTESKPVLDFRRALARDILRARRASDQLLAEVGRLRGEPLRALEDRLCTETMLPDYTRFWGMQERLRLPAPFEYLPVQPQPPAALAELVFHGFGPNTFAFHNWELFYRHTRGLHNGLDYVVPEGQPLIAVADGVMVDFRFLSNRAERSLALRPYLPERYRRPDGSRVLSNVVVGYGHLTGDPTADLVRAGDEVRAGQIIGTSGWPVYIRDDGSVGIQGNNAHLHLEVHLITDGERQLGNRQPFNPLLFWTPRLVAFQARLATHSDRPPYPKVGQPFGKLGFLTIGCFSYDPPTVVWTHEPSRGALWPEGVYSLGAMLDLLRSYRPYAGTGE